MGPGQDEAVQGRRKARHGGDLSNQEPVRASGKGRKGFSAAQMFLTQQLIAIFVTMAVTMTTTTTMYKYITIIYQNDNHNSMTAAWVYLVGIIFQPIDMYSVDLQSFSVCHSHMKLIHPSIQCLPAAPAATAGPYRLYGSTVEEYRGSVVALYVQDNRITHQLRWLVPALMITYKTTSLDDKLTSITSCRFVVLRVPMNPYTILSHQLLSSLPQSLFPVINSLVNAVVVGGFKPARPALHGSVAERKEGQLLFVFLYLTEHAEGFWTT